MSLREKISLAAQELYLRDGIEGLSMRKVAEIVGVSAPALYRYFASKEELLKEVVAEGLKVLEGYLRPGLEAESPDARLRELTENYLRFAIEQPKYFDFAFLVPSRDGRALADEVLRPVWTTFRMAIEQVAACMHDGTIAQDDPIETAITVWAEVHGLVTLYRTGRLGSDPQEFSRIYRKSVERLLRGLEPR